MDIRRLFTSKAAGDEAAPDPFAARQAALDAQQREIDAISQERQQLKSAAESATTTREAAHGALSRLLTDVTAFADADDTELPRAKTTFRAARDAESKAIAAHAAHVAEHGNLSERGQALAEAQRQLDLERAVSADRADAEQMAAAVITLIDIQRKMVDRRKTTTGLSDLLLLPAGYALKLSDPRFDPSIATTRTVFTDYLLRNVAETYADVLPAELQSELAARIQSDGARGIPRWFPCSPAWSVDKPNLKF